MTDVPAADRTVTREHNRPQLDALTKDDLIVDHSKLFERLADLQARSTGLPAAPEADASLEVIQANGEVVATFGRSVAQFLADVKDAHVATKEPYLKVSRAIDDYFFRDLRDVAQPLGADASRLGAAFVNAAAAIKRKEAEAEQERLRQEETARLEDAAAAERAGNHTQAGVLLRQAQNSEAEGQRLETVTSRTDSNLGRISGAGANMGLRKTLDFEIDRDKLDLEKLRPFIDIDALTSAVRSFNRLNGNGLTPAKELDIKAPLAGVTFSVKTDANFR